MTSREPLFAVVERLRARHEECTTSRPNLGPRVDVAADDLARVLSAIEAWEHYGDVSDRKIWGGESAEDTWQGCLDALEAARKA
jgi:hypothetical protein